MPECYGVIAVTALFAVCLTAQYADAQTPDMMLEITLKQHMFDYAGPDGNGNHVRGDLSVWNFDPREGRLYLEERRKGTDELIDRSEVTVADRNNGMWYNPIGFVAESDAYPPGNYYIQVVTESGMKSNRADFSMHDGIPPLGQAERSDGTDGMPDAAGQNDAADDTSRGYSELAYQFFTVDVATIIFIVIATALVAASVRRRSKKKPDRLKMAIPILAVFVLLGMLKMFGMSTVGIIVGLAASFVVLMIGWIVWASLNPHSGSYKMIKGMDGNVRGMNYISGVIHNTLKPSWMYETCEERCYRCGLGRNECHCGTYFSSLLR